MHTPPAASAPRVRSLPRRARRPSRSEAKDGVSRAPGAAALITGATATLGRRLAIEFARRGIHLCLAGDLAELTQLQSLAARLRGPRVRTLALPADLSSPIARLALVRDCLAALGRIDILVNGGPDGGVSTLAPLLAGGVEEPPRHARQHLAGLLLPAMLERRAGHVVDVMPASAAAEAGGPTLVVTIVVGDRDARLRRCWLLSHPDPTRLAANAADLVAGTALPPSPGRRLPRLGRTVLGRTTLARLRGWRAPRTRG